MADLPAAVPESERVGLPAPVPAPRFRMGGLQTARLAILGLGLGFFVLYLATLTSQHTFDSVSYALDIRRFESGHPITRLFHPHHLLFSSFGLLTHLALSPFRPQTTTLEAVQVFASLMGAIGIAAFAAWVYEETRSVWAAVTGAAALGATFGWWFGSTDGRANLTATAILLCGVYALDRAARLHSERRWWVSAGILLGGACLLHQNHGLFLPVALLTALLTPGSSWPQRRSWAIWLLISFLVTVIVPYSIVVFGILRMETPQDALHWMTTYAHQGTWWSLDFVRNLGADARALVKFITGYELMQPAKPHLRSAYLLVNTAWSLLLVAALAGAIGGGWWRRRAFLTPPLLGLLFYGVFFTIWDPGYFVHWFAFSAFLIAFATLGWLEAGNPWYLRAGISGLVAVLVVATGAGVIRDRMRTGNNPFITLAERVDRVSDAQDLVIASGMGPYAEAQIYVPYFARVNTIALHDIWKDASDTSAAVSSVQTSIEKVLDKGDRVFLLSDVIMDPSSLGAMEKRYGVTPEQIRDAFARYDRVKVDWQGYVVIFELKRKPEPAVPAAPEIASPPAAAPVAPGALAPPPAPESAGDRAPTPAPESREDRALSPAPRPAPVPSTRPERPRAPRPAPTPTRAPSPAPAPTAPPAATRPSAPSAPPRSAAPAAPARPTPEAPRPTAPAAPAAEKPAAPSPLIDLSPPPAPRLPAAPEARPAPGV